MVLWKMPCTRAGNFRYLGIGFRLEQQTPGLGLGFGFETCPV